MAFAKAAGRHTVGIENAMTVIALNGDSDAAMVGDCDPGIEARWRATLPLLVDELAVRLAGGGQAER